MHPYLLQQPAQMIKLITLSGTDGLNMASNSDKSRHKQQSIQFHQTNPFNPPVMLLAFLEESHSKQPNRNNRH